MFDKIFQFVLHTTSLYHIDESHGISHSMKVLQHAHNIYTSELPNPELEKQKPIIYACAILHDMCDKKYMNEEEGIQRIQECIPMTEEDMDITKAIISTMSYSKVKVNGFPELGKFQLAYHIVREADLLAAYDIDRCIIYRMHKSGDGFTSSYAEARELAHCRILKHVEDQLFTTDYSKKLSQTLHDELVDKMKVWDLIIKN